MPRASNLCYIYSYKAELFPPNSVEKILSKEGTTQGGPESMALYAASMIPLSIKKDKVKKNYADDRGAGAKLDNHKVWWDDLKRNGKPLGYFPSLKSPG